MFGLQTQSVKALNTHTGDFSYSDQTSTKVEGVWSNADNYYISHQTPGTNKNDKCNVICPAMTGAAR